MTEVGVDMADPTPKKSRNVAIGDKKDIEKLTQRVLSVYREHGCVVELGRVVWWGFLTRAKTPKA